MREEIGMTLDLNKYREQKEEKKREQDEKLQMYSDKIQEVDLDAVVDFLTGKTDGEPLLERRGMLETEKLFGSRSAMKEMEDKIALEEKRKKMSRTAIFIKE